MGKKLLTDFSALSYRLKFIQDKAQDLRQAHYQILLVILLKECIIHANMHMIIKTVKRAELYSKIVSVVLDIQTLKIV